MVRTDEPCVLSKLSAVGKVQLFAAPEIVMGHLRWFVSVHWLDKLESSTFDESENDEK